MPSGEILAQARSLQPELVEVRRDLHRHPELGMQEHRTAGTVASRLQALGLEVRTGVGGTGVVGLLRGARSGPTIALRADMDALPIQDRKQVPYASVVPGVMHACGHDGHTAILLGTADLLSRHRDRLAGQVKFLFQPAEEGPGGALPMIEAGALEDPHVDAVVGLHIIAEIPAGVVAVKYGGMSASSDGFELCVEGRGGHGAYPHQTVDAIAVAAQVVTALQTVVSRETDPVAPAVVTVGTIRGGYRGNVIADEVVMTGTVRLIDPDLRPVVAQRIERVVSGICAAMRATCRLKYNYGYPPVVNDDAVTALVESAAQKVVGPGQVRRLATPTMGAEDFSYFALARPACFFRLGGRNEDKGAVFPGHHPKYDFDEDVLSLGVAVFAQVTMDYCQ
jgi:amidohydrolase